MDPRFSTDSALPMPTVLYQPPPHHQKRDRPNFSAQPDKGTTTTTTNTANNSNNVSTRGIRGGISGTVGGHHTRALSKDSAGFARLDPSAEITSSNAKPSTATGIGKQEGPKADGPTPKLPVKRTRTARSNTERVIPTLKTNFNALPSSTNSTPIVSTSSSGSRGGAKFTVGNVSHGRLFLRPAVVRPAHELHQFVLPPSTPPSSAEDEENNIAARSKEKKDNKDPEWLGKSKLEISEAGSSNERLATTTTTLKEKLQKRGGEEARLSLTPPPKTPPQQPRDTKALESSPPVAPQQPRHNRARSFSIHTNDQRSVHSPEPGTFRVTIDRAEPIERPKTAGPKQPYPGLDVQIPSYAIGSPRFSPLGTPFLHNSMGNSSLNIPSTWGERGSAATSQRNSEFHWLAPENSAANKEAKKAEDHNDLTPYLSPPGSPRNSRVPNSSFLLPPSPSVEPAPEIFDALSFPPQSEDPSVVKYDPTNKEIIAATPARIIAQITSATFLDYQLLSDFFLTFRLFLSPPDLVAFLIARLHWAIERDDDVGRVVRVRTFVAIRHWLLNYFADDFVPSVHLREAFVTRLNDLSHMVSKKGSQSDMKIVGEIKRCWRRTCALYWDRSADKHGSVISDSIESDVTPGGDPGERKDLRESYFPRVEREYQSEASERGYGIGVAVSSSSGGQGQGQGQGKGKGKAKMMPSDSNSWPRRGKRARSALPQTMMMDGAGGSVQKENERVPSQHQNKNQKLKIASPKLTKARSGTGSSSNGGEGPSGYGNRPTSFLLSNSGKGSPGLASPFASGFKFPSEEAVQNSTATPGSPFASSQALSRKVHQQTTHKRSGSFSDALRDNRQPLPIHQKSIARSTHLLMAFPYAGSLVRGNLLPPTAAFVEVLAPSTPSNDPYRSKNGSVISSNGNNNSNRMHPGMRKWLVSVKKALGGKSSQAQIHVRTGSPPVPIGGRYSSPARAESPLTPIAREAYPRFPAPGSKDASGITRIDLLGAGVVESFQRAVQEEGRRYDDPMGAAIDEPIGSPGKSNKIKHTSIAVRSFDSTSKHSSGERTPLKSGLGDWQSLSRLSLSTEQDHAPTYGSPEHAEGLKRFEERMRLSTPTPVGSIADISGLSKGAFETSTPKRGSVATSISQDQRAANTTVGYDETQELPPARRHSTSIRSFDERSLYTTKSILDTQHTPTAGTSMSKRRFSDSSILIADEGFEYTSDLSSPIFNRSKNEPFDRPPNRMLRRRPGGNLKNANNVTELESAIELDRKDITSIGSSSLAASFQSLSLLPPQRVLSPLTLPGTREEDDVLEVDTAEMARRSRNAEEGHVGQGMLSLGALANAPPRAPTPLHRSSSVGTGTGTDAASVHPRNSFEAGVAKLALLADNASEDGGVEVALLKLEGRYDRQSKMSPMKEYFERTFFGGSGGAGKAGERLSGILSMGEAFGGKHDLTQETAPTAGGFSDEEDHLLRVKRRHKQILENQPLDTPPVVLDSAEGSYFNNACGSAGGGSVSEADQRRTMLSRRGYSDSSVPTRTEESYLRGKSSNFHAEEQRGLAAEISGHLDQSGLTEKASKQRNVGGGEEDETVESIRDDISVLSSEISFEVIDRQLTARNSSASHNNNKLETLFAGLDIPSHPLRHPPSPPLTLKQALHMPPDDDDDFMLPLQMTNTNPDRLPQNAQASSRSPPLPQHQQQSHKSAPPPGHGANPSLPSNHDPQPPAIYEATPVHLPFILAYDSELLAKQFTLIEKDALAEVDWKELVELKWKNTVRPVQDWVEFLSLSEVRGVEVVIARFNLVWKWAMSEIVLTRSLHERARTIVKLIHIAAHARRLQNYATMYQITASLLSTNIARLKKTWALISPADMATFRALESLVQPVRNFHNLRVEMDRITGEEGCIPFAGLFTHDLIYNSQRPDFIPSAPIPNRNGKGGGAVTMLVNFEKHRMTAAIVKRLLRLVEASTRYEFGAVDGVCERCLWISCLSDEEIGGLSRGLE